MRFASAMLDQYGERLLSINSFDEMDRFLKELNLKVNFPHFARVRDGIPCTEAEWDETESYLLPQLHALIARYSRLGENAFYRYYLPIDTTVQKALELLDQQ